MGASGSRSLSSHDGTGSQGLWLQGSLGEQDSGSTVSCSCTTISRVVRWSVPAQWGVW